MGANMYHATVVNSYSNRQMQYSVAATNTDELVPSTNIPSQV